MKKSALLVLLFIFIAGNMFAQDNGVLFQVDMRVKIKELKFDPATQHVSVRGNFNGWGETQLTDVNNDTIYEARVDTNNGAAMKTQDTLFFKFYFGTPDNWEQDPLIGGGNRRHIVTAVPTPNVYFAYFDNDSVVTLVANGNINFAVDISPVRTAGIIDPSAVSGDSIQIRGSFNGWGNSDRARSNLQRNALNTSKWFLNVPFVNANVNEALYYKFLIDLENPTGLDTLLAGDNGYERPLSTGGGNRSVVFTGAPDQVVPEVYYDDVRPDYVITNQGVQITFRVNMTDAMDASKVPTVFDPAKDTLYWIGSQPSWLRTQGLRDNGQHKIVPMLREGTTNNWSGTLTIQAPSWNGLLYRYSFQRNLDSSWVSEPTGFANFAYRVRYIAQTGANAFVQPYTAPLDNWTQAEVKTDQEVTPYSVTEIGNNVVDNYSLSQNYPNPFNPSTKINFSLKEAGFVTLKVYNQLGELVSTLVNEQLDAKSYEVSFNAANLSSGLYFYTLSTNNFTVTKKMMLLK